MSITETARAFIEACDTGKGWAGCAQYDTCRLTNDLQRATAGPSEHAGQPTNEKHGRARAGH